MTNSTMNKPSPRRWRKRLLLLAGLALATLCWLRSSRTAAPVTTTAEPTPATHRVSARPVALAGHDASTAAAANAPEDAAEPVEVPPGSIAFRRVSLDDLRSRAGLPPISPGVIGIDAFPTERSAERADPDLHALYTVERGLHRTRVVSEHELLESERFARQAREAPDADDADLLERAAHQHAALATRWRQRHDDLQHRRADLLAELAERTPNDDTLPEDTPSDAPQGVLP